MNRVMMGGAVVAALGMAGGVSGQAAPPTLAIDGTSTVRSWTCEVRSFEVELSPASGFEAGVLRGEPALETVDLTFPVGAIECGNDKMNDHLRDALQADSHPEIRYGLSTYDIAGAESGVEVSADGSLMIAGTEQPIRMAVTVVRDDHGGIRVRGEQEVDMTDFGVSPPSLMLGVLKVGEVVTVRFDVPLEVRHLRVAATADTDSR